MAGRARGIGNMTPLHKKAPVSPGRSGGQGVKCLVFLFSSNKKETSGEKRRGVRQSKQGDRINHLRLGQRRKQSEPESSRLQLVSPSVCCHRCNGRHGATDNATHIAGTMTAVCLYRFGGRLCRRSVNRSRVTLLSTAVIPSFYTCLPPCTYLCE